MSAAPPADLGEAQRRLLAGHWYNALATMLADAEPTQAARFADLAGRVLDLDAEDFADLADGVDRPWAKQLRACAFPRRADDPARGALASLVPLYELMLEALELRALRHEPLLQVVTAHLMGEYLPQLAWEKRLGHAGDPCRLRNDVGERWGTDDPACAHPSALRATAKRAITACESNEEGFTAYLDRFHSRQGEALAICAMNHKTVRPGQRPDAGETCPNPCRWALQGSVEERAELDARVRLAKLYVDSPLVALRHHAPVGHFFAVPSEADIRDAWDRTWERVSQPWKDGCNPLTRAGAKAEPEPDEPLPGMAALVSAVAGRDVRAGTLIRDIGADVGRELGV